MQGVLLMNQERTSTLRGLLALFSASALVSACTIEMPRDISEGVRDAAKDGSTLQHPPALVVRQATYVYEPPDFRALIAAQAAAVVHVSAIEHVTGSSRSAARAESESDPDEAIINELLQRLGISMNRDGEFRGLVREQGSGFLVSADGYILTSAHLLTGASVVTVELTDGREFGARIIGVDEPSDIAVLKIEGVNLPSVTLADSGHLEPGQWVAAIGAPYGLANSVTVGVVSALDRLLPGDEAYIPLIQTTLLLNPGNSGGPLFDLGGKVIGINSTVIFHGGRSAGVSFAIPIEIARAVEEQLIRTGHVERGYVGAAVQDVSLPLAQAFGLKRATGALVHSIDRGGPADQANLRLGDIILQIDGRNVDSPTLFRRRIGGLRSGQVATLGIWREGARLDLHIRVAEREQLPFADAERHAVLLPLLQVRRLTSKEQQEAGTDGRLLITTVSDPVAAAGVQPGDVVLAVNSEPVRTSSELRRELMAHSSALALLVERDGERMFVPLPLGNVKQGRSAILQGNRLSPPDHLTADSDDTARAATPMRQY
jgi:serine protease Do